MKKMHGPGFMETPYDFTTKQSNADHKNIHTFSWYGSTLPLTPIPIKGDAPPEKRSHPYLKRNPSRKNGRQYPHSTTANILFTKETKTRSS